MQAAPGGNAAADQTAGNGLRPARESPGVIERILASATTQDGRTTISFPDGTTITLVGVTRLDRSFFR